MAGLSQYFWPIAGLLAAACSFFLLYHDPQIHHLAAQDILNTLQSLPGWQWGAAGLCTLLAYGALAWYDRIALLHLGHKLPWSFISLVSFTTYALSHNIGASIFSGAVVRYRAYSTKGLTLGEVSLLVAFCSFTFLLGVLVLSFIVIMWDYPLLAPLTGIPPTHLQYGGIVIGLFLLAYILGSLLPLTAFHFRKFRLNYPKPPIIARQFLAGPLELLGAAGIIYFVLPASSNPGFLIVLAIFLASFSAAILSHAPGGLGVLEVIFFKSMQDVPPAHIIAALLIWRLFYLILPFIFSLGVVFVFERQQLKERKLKAPDNSANA